HFRFLSPSACPPTSPSFPYTTLFRSLWDALALGVWAWDLLRLPRPAQLELRRIWNAPAALGSPSRIEIELINAARVSIFAEATDDVPRALRTEPATVEIRAGAGSSGRAAYSVMPVERG